MFSINQKVVYPGHGVAIIQSILEKCLGGSSVFFYELRFLEKDMTILLPVNNVSNVGVRELASSQTIETLYKLVATKDIKTSVHDVSSSSWNKRSKRYQGLLRSGDLLEIAKIYRELSYIACHKELSFGERGLLTQTEQLLAQEIALVEGRTEHDVSITLRATCAYVPTIIPHRQISL